LGQGERPAAEFFADHPFLFFIRDTTTGLVIFQGRVTDPCPS
jgi:serpin B